MNIIAHSSVHGGNLLKEHALMVCAAIDEDDPQYHTLVQPLILRIEKFFAHPGVELDFTDEIRLIRARRLIEQGRYTKQPSLFPYSLQPLFMQKPLSKETIILLMLPKIIYIY